MVELEGQYKRLKYNAKTFIAFKRGSGILDGRWQMFETYTQVEFSTYSSKKYQEPGISQCLC